MKMIINGKPADSVSGMTREIYSPADGAILDTVPVASEEDLELAFEAAREGQKKWAKVPVYKRAEILMRFLELVERDKEELGSLTVKNKKRAWKRCKRFFFLSNFRYLYCVYLRLVL